MIVYHGSTLIVEQPDIAYSTRNLDFGKGFYVTTVREQAERWAKRKCTLSGTDDCFVNEYEMTDFSGEIRCLEFDTDEEWIDFVCKCRDGDEIYREYDVIKGKVANDKVYRVVDFYKSGIWDIDRAIKEIKAYKTYDQIAFITQKCIKEFLVYRKAHEVQI